MVVGDDVGGGDDKEALEITLSGVESRINLTPEMKIVVSAVLCFAKHRLLPGDQFLGYIKHLPKREARRRSRAKRALVARPMQVGAPPSLVWASWLPSRIPKV